MYNIDSFKERNNDMNKKIRVAASFTSAVMVISLLTACDSAYQDMDVMDVQSETAAVTDSSGDAAETDAKMDSDELDFTELYGDEVIELTVFSQLANYSGNMTGWFAELMKEKYNCEITIIPDLNGAFDLRTESGNPGDIIVFGNNGDQYRQAVENGLLLEWNEDDIAIEVSIYVRDISHPIMVNNRVGEGD